MVIMNGEVPSVPITTLAGITSLTDLLPELPLPTPLPSTVQNKSLLYHARLAESAKRHLSKRDEGLTQQIVHALRQTSTDHIELKDSLVGDSIEGDIPELLRGVLAADPNVFKGTRSQTSGRSGNRSQQKQQSSAAPYPAQNFQPFPQNNSPRINQQHSPSRAPEHAGSYPQNSSSKFQQSFQNFAQTSYSNAAGTMNGEHPGAPESHYIGRNVNQHSRNTAPVASPAQATVAEPLVPVAKQPESLVPKPTTLNPQKYPQMKQPIVLLEQLSHPSLPAQGSNKKKSAGQPFVMLEPLDEKTLKSIKYGGSVKAKSDRRSGSKRRYEEDNDGHSSRRKRRRNYYEDNNSDAEVIGSDSDSEMEVARKKKKDKRHKRVNQQALSVEELLESPTFKKFSSAMEYILDTAEDINFGSLDPNDEDAECPPESLISKQILTELVGETAKLKSMGVLNQVPADKLVKLLTVLQWNIRDGTKLLPTMTQDIDDEEEQKLWRHLTMERVMRSMDSSLTALYIMTSKEMPKHVYLEDVIERIILFGKFQLQNTVYPEYDPVYKVDPKKDGYHTSSKLKRARAGQVKHKSTINLYNKMADLVNNLGQLIDIQEMTDTTILQVSTLGVSPFFVENISELQLNAMKLVTTIFTHYEKHRQLILEDIFASLARLPSSKRNLRNYRLNSEESIQMVTALALQLIQCVIKLPSQSHSRPEPLVEEEPAPSSSKRGHQNQKKKKPENEQDTLIVTSFENAMRTGYNFLSVFLKKCTVKGEEDYRPLFENFVQDLLATVNKPEWPSSELMLSLLGRILVKQFSNKSVDMSLRVASLEYLGIVASRLRKDAVSSQLNQESIDEIVAKVNEVDSDDEAPRRSSRGGKNSPVPEGQGESAEDQAQSLQKAMLEYLTYNSESEPAYWFACQFYIAQWYRDATMEAEKSEAAHDEFDETEAELTTEELQNTERRKNFLMKQVELTLESHKSGRPHPSNLEHDSACLIARYLSSKRPFAQSFDIYLTQILRVLSETAVAVRTKAMKCLTAVVESDPGILARTDMQKGVHGRFLDQSTMVREAAVELVGRFILIRPDLIPKYYDMLTDRILDTGISVRKRVIKIFRDICIEQGDFQKIPEMCVKMIRRVNDEEGIKKLVNDVFQTMWFTPLSTRDKDTSKLLQRVVNITDVVAACKDTGFEFFEQLLENLLKKDEDGNYNKSAVTSCRQIVDCLVENVLSLEERSVDVDTVKGCSQRLVACLSTLFLFSKIKPDLMIKHATTLQPYLDIKCSTQGDFYVLHYVARILEVVVPLMDHPSESFLAQLEEDMIKLILKHGMMVLQSCVRCLGAVVNNVSHNYALVKDCFQKFFGVLSRLMADHREDPENATLKIRKPTLLRSLFTVGLLCKHFDFDSSEMGETKTSVKDKVYDVLHYFVFHEDEEVRTKALTGLGFLFVRHYEYMLGVKAKELYVEFLSNEHTLVRLKVQVLKNLQYYLQEEEVRMQKADAEWRKHSKEEDLKEMNDIQSGMASTVMQVYLKQVLESFFNQQSQVRMAALSVINLVLRQGLVHPVQCVPYLISFGTDSEQSIRVKADQQLQEIEKKYPGFIHMKSLHGLKLSYRLQQILQNDHSKPIRGMRSPDDNVQSLNAYLYTVLRSNRPHRRAILTTLLNLFDDSAKITLAEQVYISDNLSFFPYQTQDEPLFIIHQIDIIVSVSGSNLLQSFREKLYGSDREHHGGLVNNQNGQNGAQKSIDDEEDDDPEALLERLPACIQPLLEICRFSQGCILLLHLKQHLKELYGFTDSKIHNYSPAETKLYDKPVTRKFLVKFNPETVLEVLAEGTPKSSEDIEVRTKLVNDYLEFKALMLCIDPPDDDDSDGEGKTGTPNPAKPDAAGTATAPAGTAGEAAPGKEGAENQPTDTDANANTEANSNETSKPHHPPPPPTHHTGHHSTHHHSLSSRLSKHHHLIHGTSEKKKIKIQTPSSTRTSSSTFSSSFSSTPKSSSSSSRDRKKHKKRKRRYKSDSEDDSDDDPDFVL
ncbi:nipped-B-like protein B isoform X2 [Mizuhopecten yessoensis]|uniref:Nipped-B protein n=1 Tax=Mizuhopecten yessoensis TaxID=6573 RepID=A0A210Q0G0_MIZYE|nr:nipped-B-like protein B isoform X2 [Mizuhopecten yessoensis]OWF42149.1 Nipped-B-like protein [Mizuhopecten yessoensis]